MAKIYELVCEQLVLYVGSTIRTLTQREYQHRAKSNKSGSKDIPKDCIWKIKLLEKCAVELRYERELYYYNLLKPLYNMKSPYNPMTQLERTKDYQSRNPNQTIRYRESHREYYREYAKAYYERKKAQNRV